MIDQMPPAKNLALLMHDVSRLLRRRIDKEAQAIGARQTWLIHMSHDAEHEEVDAALPEGISLAYDGLALSF